MKKDNENKNGEQPYTGRTYAYIAAGLVGAAAVFLGLAFTVLGIYSLIGAVLCCLASLAFTNVQKRKNNFNRLTIINICAYAVLGITAAFFVGGIIWSAAN